MENETQIAFSPNDLSSYQSQAFLSSPPWHQTNFGSQGQNIIVNGTFGIAEESFKELEERLNLLTRIPPSLSTTPGNRRRIVPTSPSPKKGVSDQDKIDLVYYHLGWLLSGKHDEAKENEFGRKFGDWKNKVRYMLREITDDDLKEMMLNDGRNQYCLASDIVHSWRWLL